MKTATTILPKANLSQVKEMPKVEQYAAVLTSDEYYDLEAELAEEMSNYYHLRYNY
ncbi:hypothetical protein [Scytonema sp. UIC 10036]|uniref:hypothetical protein n=1 Tax=Scytonema sp. UIC 10036 TaxID=2304196 RepID=UPI00140F79C0|nr:hypothetical protein [Scytonema sp. UIC 10036]